MVEAPSFNTDSEAEVGVVATREVNTLMEAPGVLMEAMTEAMELTGMATPLGDMEAKETQATVTPSTKVRQSNERIYFSGLMQTFLHVEAKSIFEQTVKTNGQSMADLRYF